MASIACIVLVETDNPLLIDPGEALKTPKGTLAMRQAVIDALPNLTRVIAVLTEESAQFMCMAHEYALDASGLGHFVGKPPEGYVSPADQKPV